MGAVEDCFYCKICGLIYKNNNSKECKSCKLEICKYCYKDNERNCFPCNEQRYSKCSTCQECLLKVDMDQICQDCDKFQCKECKTKHKIPTDKTENDETCLECSVKPMQKRQREIAFQFLMNKSGYESEYHLHKKIRRLSEEEKEKLLSREKDVKEKRRAHLEKAFKKFLGEAASGYHWQYPKMTDRLRRGDAEALIKEAIGNYDVDIDDKKERLVSYVYDLRNGCEFISPSVDALMDCDGDSKAFKKVLIQEMKERFHLFDLAQLCWYSRFRDGFPHELSDYHPEDHVWIKTLIESWFEKP